ARCLGPRPGEGRDPPTEGPKEGENHGDRPASTGLCEHSAAGRRTRHARHRRGTLLWVGRGGARPQSRVRGDRIYTRGSQGPGTDPGGKYPAPQRLFTGASGVTPGAGARSAIAARVTQVVGDTSGISRRTSCP